MWMGSSFWHSACWNVLTEAWEKTLNLSMEIEASEDASPVDALVDINQSPAQVLDDQIQTWKVEAEKRPKDKIISTRKFCASCQPKRDALMGWVGLEEDELLAVRALKSEPELDVEWD